MTNWPPRTPFFSNRVTSCPRFFAVVAASRPAGPPPITATFFFSAAGTASASEEAEGSKAITLQQEVEEQLKKAIGAFEITAGHAQQEGIGERFDAAMDPEEETDAFLIDSVRYCTEVLGLDKDALLRELAKLEDPGVKAFFIVNPSNPASHALSEKTLRRLVQVVEKNPGLIILTDDVYGTFVQDFQTVYSVLPYNTILVYSFSKLYGVTGWRVGLIAMNRDNVCDRLLDELPQELVRQAGAIAQKVLRELICK